MCLASGTGRKFEYVNGVSVSPFTIKYEICCNINYYKLLFVRSFARSLVVLITVVTSLLMENVYLIGHLIHFNIENKF